MERKALSIAHLVISYGTKHKTPVSNLQLQKILYILQTAYIRKQNGKILFSDDFYAWQYGPVIPSIYNEYSGYGACGISSIYEDCKEIPNKIRNELTPIIKKCCEYTSWQLADVTNASGTPWKQIFRNGEGNRMKISKELIRKDAISKGYTNIKYNNYLVFNRFKVNK